MTSAQCDYAGVERAQLDVFDYEGVDLVELLGPKNPADAAAVVISVPHGGFELLQHLIPDRDATHPVYCPSGTCGTVRDTNTLEIALLVMDMFIQNYCKVPFVVINKLYRRKLDADREMLEAAHENPIAEEAWLSYHNFIRDAQSHIIGKMKTVTNVHGYEGARGLLLDITVFLGRTGILFTVHHSSIGVIASIRWTSIPTSIVHLTNSQLWSKSEVGTLSQARFLPGQSYECLVRGPGSLGTRVSNLLPDDMGLCGAGLPSFDYPSPLAAQTDPSYCEKMALSGSECKYYTGGFISRIHEYWDWINLTGIKFNRDATLHSIRRCCS